MTNISYTPQPTSKAGRSSSPSRGPEPAATTTIRIAFHPLPPPPSPPPSPSNNPLETLTVHSCGLDLLRLRVRVHHLASAVEDWSAARSVAISLRASRETRIEFGNEGDGNVEEKRGPEQVNRGGDFVVPEEEEEAGARARVCVFFGCGAGPESDLFCPWCRETRERMYVCAQEHELTHLYPSALTSTRILAAPREPSPSWSRRTRCASSRITWRVALLVTLGSRDAIRSKPR